MILVPLESDPQLVYENYPGSFRYFSGCSS